MEINSNVSLCNGELKDFVVQNSSTQPTTNKNGKVVYDTTNKAFYGYQSNKWKKFATSDDVPSEDTIKKYAKEVDKRRVFFQWEGAGITIRDLKDGDKPKENEAGYAFISHFTDCKEGDWFIDTTNTNLRGVVYMCTGVDDKTQTSAWNAAPKNDAPFILQDIIVTDLVTHTKDFDKLPSDLVTSIPDHLQGVGNFVFNPKLFHLYKIVVDSSGELGTKFICATGTSISYQTIIDTLGYTPKDVASDIWMNSDSYAALTTVETDKVYYITEV